ncbi:MAG TPA: flagellar FliJ family protein, partial [Desulfatiglandales bacterium]|nr:flagellar FliJ family protein [Desulfatiglandales bacterium]
DGLKDAKGNVKKKETELKKESIKKKSLETLKDLQQNRYIRSMEKEEQKALDELAVLRRGRI